MKLYLRYLSIHFKSAMQYKASFFMTSLGQFLNAFSSLLAIWFLMDRFHQVDGYSMGEVVFCYAVVMISFSLAEVFARGFDGFASLVRNGEFDRIMVRPRSVVFQVLASKLELTRWAKIVQAVPVLGLGLISCQIQWDFLRAVGLLFMILGGAAYFSGLFLIYASFCFFTLEGLEFMNVFTDGGREFGAYPLAVYGKGMLTAFTFVLPMACFQYYPFLFLTGRSGNPLLLLTPAICIVFLLPCYAFWRFGVRHYKSSGS